MRTIKFRGWNTKQQVMYSAEELAEDQLTLLTTGKFINVDGDNKNNSEIYDHIIPLQFTGLLDRNGKEVYEGDLYISGNMKAIRQVYYHNGAFCGGMSLEESTPLCWDSDGEILFVDDFISRITVIGNIYESKS